MPLARRARQGVWLALALALAACTQTLKPPTGDVASTLTLPTLDGEVFDASSLRGHHVLVNFWRPGCPHCVADLPRIASAAKAKGAVSLAVMVSGKEESAKQVIADTKFDGIVLVDDGSVRQRFAIKAVPYTLVVRPDGTASAAFLGEQTEATFRDALGDAK